MPIKQRMPLAELMLLAEEQGKLSALPDATSEATCARCVTDVYLSALRRIKQCEHEELRRSSFSSVPG